MAKYVFTVGEKLTAARTNNFCQEGEVANSSLVTTAGQPGGAWLSYTATWTNISNGTKTAAYMLLGKTCFFRAQFVVTTTPAVAGNVTVSLPLTGTSSNLPAQFSATFWDNSFTSKSWPALVYSVSTTAVTLAAAQFPALRSGYDETMAADKPFTWATDDRIEVAGFYEVA
ncbi:MAG: hypothetical protein ACO3VO_09200 [Ilumatobacteraceae bacterium]